MKDLQVSQLNMPWMQMEMVCCVKPATLWIPISRQMLCREHCWQLSEDSQCSLREEKALIRTQNCSADPKCSGRDNVGTRAFQARWHFGLVQCEECRQNYHQRWLFPNASVSHTKTNPKSQQNVLFKSPIPVFLFLNASPHPTRAF